MNRIAGVSIRVDVLVAKDILSKVDNKVILEKIQDNIFNLINDDINYKVIGGKGKYIYANDENELIKDIK